MMFTHKLPGYIFINFFSQVKVTVEFGSKLSGPRWRVDRLHAAASDRKYPAGRLGEVIRALKIVGMR